MSCENFKGTGMLNMNNKESQQNIVQSTYNYLSNSIPWWNSAGPHIVLYPTSTNLYANLNNVASNQLKQDGNPILEQESSSTQSTGHSHHEISGKRDDNLKERCLSAQSGASHYKVDQKGDEHTQEKLEQGHPKQLLSAGSTQFFYAPQKLDCNQSLAYVPYAYSDAHYPGIMATYGSHAVIHPQMMGTFPSTRVALPLQPTGEEPIYVNAKQYHAILRRRQHRAKLEFQTKLAKNPRKPYLHESRHLHAMKRARGTGGRFLNTKKTQDAPGSHNFSGSEPPKHGRIASYDNGTVISSATSACSEITSVSTSGRPGMVLQPQTHLGFASNLQYRSRSMLNNGAELREPITR
ncbi:nuclear transcription factor Y subunit A-7-like isoform X2 [Phalaenopsis equestris]|uniref:nuclear transcription factor Y subunit A-7-like isoform X2 n=1 Tax=Phalaenopsis equestris TaxID=78828 RepID=UPI0009E239FF|nr:nuclear transcription factor Y subunit A-7-like isoform X2 [Phalaenopsis equestris]